MIIIDFSQVIIANLMVSIGNHTNVKIEVGLLRHMVLNTIRLLNTKFRKDYGELIIACDDNGYWRKTIFPYYKAHRKRDRDASELDWNAVYDAIHQIRDELRDNFPYRVIRVPTAEADDIIASLVMEYGDTEKILIISGDKDFQQLQKYPNVKQYDPNSMRRGFITCPDPERFLKEHIIRGDVGDGVPNIMSRDDCIMTRTRQSPLMKEKVNKWLDLDPKDFCTTEMLKNYHRNKLMVDLTLIPHHIREEVLTSYNSQADKSRSNIWNYFIAFKLKTLMESLQDF